MENPSNKFWTVIQEERRIDVPHHLKFILHHYHVDCFAVMAALNETDFPDIEKFTRSEAYKFFVPENAIFSQYYGDLTPMGKPEDFRLSKSDIILLNIMIQFSIEKVRNWQEQENHQTVQDRDTVLYATTAGSKSTLLDMLIRSVEENSKKKKKQGYRYTDALKHICAFQYILSGPIAYKMLSSNLLVPSISTVRRLIYEKGKATEGACRGIELRKFLDDRKLPLDIWLSEDATRLTNRVQYDSSSNQLVGFVLPMDNNSSMPVINSFPALSAEKIAEHYANNGISSLMYVYIAQPLATNAPSFCLCLFGTDNKFDAKNVLNRWTFIINSLRSQGITVHGCSGDADPRILKAMRVRSQLGIAKDDTVSLNGSPISITEFHSQILPELVFVQDPVHVGTKLRNRFLSPSRVLPMGKYCVSVSHVKALMEKLSKDKHGLQEKDINSTDKMNFPAVMRLSNPKILHLLREHVPNSDATQMYLKLTLYTIGAYLSTSLSTAERIYCLWYSLFVFRVWRSFLANHKYSSTDNFLSPSTYICIEINAHALLSLVFRCIESKSFKMFIPWLYGSQPCESFFRTYRAMSTIFLTVTNSTMLEALHKLNKIQFLSDAVSLDFDSMGEKIHFPRTNFLNASFESYPHEIDLSSVKHIPKENSDLNIEVIAEILRIAKHDALRSTSALGIESVANAVNDCSVPFINESSMNTNEEEKIDDDQESDEVIENFDVEQNNVDYDADDCDQEDQDNNCTILSKVRGVDLKSYPRVNVDTLKDNSPFTTITDNQGKIVVVRKSSICWMLNKNSCKLSSDRLQRVKDRDLCNDRIAHRGFMSKPEVFDTIYITDWCLFHKEGSKDCLVGNILSFAYYEEKLTGRIEYSSEYANVRGNTKTIGVLCAWYTRNGEVLELDTQYRHGYHNISTYVITIPTPDFVNGHLCIQNHVIDELKKANISF